MNGGPSNTILDYRGHLSVLEHDLQSLSIRPRPGLVRSDAELVEEGRGVRLGRRRITDMHRETAESKGTKYSNNSSSKMRQNKSQGSRR